MTRQERVATVAETRPDLHVLLVSRSVTWCRAVRSAAGAIGGLSVSMSDGRDAIVRLAGGRRHYSHVLVDRNDAQGLMPALADLATEYERPDTAVLLLGVAGAERPRVRVISDADSGVVKEALMTQPARSGPGKSVSLADLRAALDGALIDARYQPIVRMADRVAVGLEALARLNHPTEGVLLPDRFVPQIEDAGLAEQLTGLISGRVFTDLTGPSLCDSGLRVSVNFPLDVILRPAALDRLEAQRAAAGIPASRIVIELTESRPVDDLVTLRQSLEQLRGLGYGVAIDDVGPAVPGLASLLDLPFSSLKLDKDLVMQVLEAPETERFLATTIADAKKHGLTVVAEGVETQAIWDRMLTMGADEAQGFLAARALPVTAVPVWLEAWTGPG